MFYPTILLNFSDYKEYHTDTTVRFTVTISEAKLAKAMEEGLHKTFKLTSSLSTNSMVCDDWIYFMEMYLIFSWPFVNWNWKSGVELFVYLLLVSVIVMSNIITTFVRF